MSLVILDNVEKNYGDFKLNISMQLQEGRVTGLIGKNGAGKSTTLKLILGLIKADSGNVTIFNKNSKDITGEDKALIGVALAESGFSSEFNIKDIIYILKKMYKNFDEKFFKNNCDKLELPYDKSIGDFSTGMKAKLRTLVALSHRAKLLIMDEPTSGLDIEARIEVLNIIRDYLIEDETRSILMTSHISGDLEGLCDDIYLIDNGKIILYKDTDVILDNYAIIKVNDEQYKKLDKDYLEAVNKESFGYTCLTSEKQYYIDNFPDVVIEKAGIDELIIMLTGGKK